MASSGTLNSSSYHNGSVNTSYWHLQLNWTQTSKDPVTNKSKISWNVKTIRSSGSGSLYVGNISAVINNKTVYSCDNSNRWLMTNGATIANGTTEITHNNDGTKTFSASIKGAIYSYADSVSGSANFTLDTIPRYANPVPVLSARTETSLTIAWTADGNVDQLSYSTDNGSTFTALTAPNASSGSFTVTGLSVGTTYPVVLKARRTDSQLINNSSAVDMATYSYPYAANMPDFTIGNAVSIGLFNPLGRSVTVEIFASNGNSCGTTTTSGTSVSLTPTAATLYASIPSALSDNYSVNVVYSGNTETRTGGLYNVDQAASKPTVSALTYADSNGTATAITGDASKIVQNISTPTYTATGIAGVNSATISTVVVSVNGATVNLTLAGTTATGTGSVINSTADVVATVTVTDSRGITNTKDVTVSMIAWNSPTAVFTVERQSNFYSETDMLVDATYTEIGSSTITISVLGQAVPITGQTTPTDVTATLTDNVQSTVIFDNNFAWNISITLTDSFGGTTTYNTYISRGIPEVFFDRFRNSVGLNCFPQHDNSLETPGDIYADNVDITGAYKINGASIFAPATITPTFTRTDGSATISNATCKTYFGGILTVISFTITTVTTSSGNIIWKGTISDVPLPVLRQMGVVSQYLPYVILFSIETDGVVEMRLHGGGISAQTLSGSIMYLGAI